MSHVMRKPDLPYVKDKRAGQPEHLYSLFCTFDVLCLDTVVSSFYIREF